MMVDGELYSLPIFRSTAWGVWICRKAASARIGIADMWGPVVTDPNDDFYCDCTIASNNTGELLGMFNVLAWAKRQGGQEPLAICFDSMYARNVTSGVWKPKKNKGIGSLCFEAFTAENKRRAGGVTFIHVKGHSDDIGNDHADDRVQWGKADGPYCRFRSDGSHEGDHLDSPHPCDSQPGPSSTSHPSPTKRFRTPSQSLPFKSNLSSIRKRTDVESRLSSRSNVSGFNAVIASNTSNQALRAISCRRSLNFSSSGMFLTGDSPLPSTKRLDVCLRAHQATPLRSEGVEWEETSVNSTPSVPCSPSGPRFNFISDPSKLDAFHFNTSLEEASYDATSTTCSNPIATRRNSRSNTLASTTRNSKRHTYNLRARKTNTG